MMITSHSSTHITLIIPSLPPTALPPYRYAGTPNGRLHGLQDEE